MIGRYSRDADAAADVRHDAGEPLEVVKRVRHEAECSGISCGGDTQPIQRTHARSNTDAAIIRDGELVKIVLSIGDFTFEAPVWRNRESDGATKYVAVIVFACKNNTGARIVGVTCEITACKT